MVLCKWGATLTMAQYYRRTLVVFLGRTPVQRKYATPSTVLLPVRGRLFSDSGPVLFRINHRNDSRCLICIPWTCSGTQTELNMSLRTLLMYSLLRTVQRIGSHFFLNGFARTHSMTASSFRFRFRCLRQHRIQAPGTL